MNRTIFKSLLYLTAEEENSWKKDIAEWLNECTCKEDGTDYTAEDYEVQDRFYEDIWDMYDCEKSNLHKELPNNIIAIADVGKWNGRFHGGKILGNNLNEVLFMGRDHMDINCYCNRYDVCSDLAHHDATDHITYRMIKEGVDADWLLDKLVEEGLSGKEITKYTKSLRPYVKEIYGF